MLTAVYIAALALVALSALWQRLWWLAAAMGAATAQALSVALGSPKDAYWLTHVWMRGEIAALVPAAGLVIACVLRETRELAPPRRFWLRMAAGCTGISLAGMVWLYARYETAFWIFTVGRAKFWMASAVALTVIAVFNPRVTDGVTQFTLLLAGAHALTAPFPNSQPIFRVTAILACSLWLLSSLAGRESRGASCAPRR